MKKLLMCAGLLVCLSANNTVGMSTVCALLEGVSKQLASLPHNIKVGTGIACYEISGASAFLTLVFMNDKHFTKTHIFSVAIVSMVAGYLGHQIYKHTYTMMHN